MYTDERSSRLAIEQPIAENNSSPDDKQERMRQLANVFIDMFQTEWLEAIARDNRRDAMKEQAALFAKVGSARGWVN